MFKRALVIYHYYEKDSTYRENFLHFLLTGFVNCIDYIIVISGSSTIDFPALNNVKYFYVENKNNDFGAYSYIIKNEYYEILDYDYYFFINSSVRGPYVAPSNSRSWIDTFIEKLGPNDGAVGSTINILTGATIYSEQYQNIYGGAGPFSHIQTSSYLLPKSTFLYLINEGFYNELDPIDKDQVIIRYEIRMSQLIIKSGMNIKCLLPEYNSIDYRDAHVDLNPTSVHGDSLNRFGYFGRTPHPFETVFTKTNRDLFSLAYLNRLTYSMICNLKIENLIEEKFDFNNYIKKIITEANLPLSIRYDEEIYRSEQILQWVRDMLIQVPESRGFLDDILNQTKK